MNKESYYDKLWEKVILIEEFSSTIRMFDYMVYEYEYNLKQSYEFLSDINNKFLSDIIEKTEETKKYEIHISEKLYTLFNTYNTIFWRAYYLFLSCKSKWNIMKFYNDEIILNNLRLVITNQKEFNEFISEDIWLLNKINAYLKDKIKKEIKIWKSAKDFNQFESSNIILKPNIYYDPIKKVIYNSGVPIRLKNTQTHNFVKILLDNPWEKLKSDVIFCKFELYCRGLKKKNWDFESDKINDIYTNLSKSDLKFMKDEQIIINIPWEWYKLLIQ